MSNSRSPHNIPSPAITYERFNNIADDNDHDIDNDNNQEENNDYNNDRYGLSGISPCNSDKRALPRREDSTDSQDGSGAVSHHQHQPVQSLRHNNSRTRSPTNLSSSPDHRYEEFSSKLTLQCPTCKGKGKLTQGWLIVCHSSFLFIFFLTLSTLNECTS